MDKPAVIGIDLGTTYSCAAIVEGGRPRVISDTGGSYLIPSVVAIDQKGNRLVGQAAKRQILMNPRQTVYASKRLIGRSFDSDEVRRAKSYIGYQILPTDNKEVVVKLRDEDYSLSEIAALILDHVRNVSQDRLGREIEKAVVTVPAYFNDRQRQSVRTAGELAKLEIIRIINEPTAAALAYGFGKGLNQKIAIYDLGGGTFDISILELRNHIFEVKATGGDTFLGGVDFDNRLTEWVLNQFEKEHGINLSKDPIAHQRVQDACEQAKIELSERTSARVNIPYIALGPNGPINIDITITREQFENLITDLVDSTLITCDKVLSDAHLKPEDMDSIILVGGSTRIPLVARKVSEFFKKAPSKAVHPDEAVAIGAAILADNIVRGRDQAIMLLDVLPITIGIKVGHNNVMPIFTRNSPVPNQKQKIFTTSKDNQVSLNLTILQGDSPNANECVQIGELQFSGLKPAPKGQARMEATFMITPEGILTVSARDPDTGKQEKSIINVISSESKMFHANLIEPKKPVTDKPKETVITRTITRERYLKVPETTQKISEQKPSPQRASSNLSNQPEKVKETSKPEITRKKSEPRLGSLGKFFSKIFSRKN